MNGVRYARLRTSGTCWLAIASLTLLADSAAGQYQIQQDGRLFDANPQIGSGGRNYTRPVSPLMGGNPYATGNARFGQSLRSYSPISDPTAFRGRLGSSTLSSFRRDSVSVGDVSLYRQTPQTWGGLATPYYDPAQTAATAGYLRGQVTPYAATRIEMRPRTRTTPMTSADVSPLDPRIDQRFPDPTMPDRRLTVEPLAPRSTITSSIFSLPAIPQAIIDDPTSLRSGRQNADRLFQPGGLPPRPDDMYLTSRDRLDDPGSAVGGPIDLLLGERRMGDFLDDPRLGDRVGEDGLPDGLTETLASLSREPEPDVPSEQPSALLEHQRISDASMLPGADVYNDMQMALTLIQEPDSVWFEEMQAALTDDPELRQRAGGDVPTDASEFATQRLTQPLASFVGQGESMLNDELLEAAALLEVGHYYEAASRYEIARQLAPHNPLPLMGKAHALLGAGDYESAALLLVRALETHPEIARFRIDLVALMGGGEIIDIRRADIMRRLEDREDMRLRFLLGYLEYFGGNADHGLENLERAAAEADPTSVISRYPQLIRQAGNAASEPGTDAGSAKPPTNRSDDREAPPLRREPAYHELVVPPPVDDNDTAESDAEAETD